ncbi:metalloproteinase inhibitor 2-like [Syngnathus typhle]|uniref:metalloproteinase inhibitor 2-like n=1 Tax=Syngnathus typhle TaxID=161592 RepID=UPI002A6A0BC5|nr:metalloproteinase inhibitor 2-like [Syngnathus typhle]
MGWENFALLLLFALWGLQEEGAQACTCSPMHPQQLYCQDHIIVIKAKVVGVIPGDTASGGLAKYEIKHLKTLKGAEKLFSAVHTPPYTATCGITLTQDVEYLFMGRLESDNLHVSLCEFHQPWKDLSNTQKLLLYRYGEGCTCTIKSCLSLPCCMTSTTECLWTDYLPKKKAVHYQAENYACVKMGDGNCAWDMPAVYRSH